MRITSVACGPGLLALAASLALAGPAAAGCFKQTGSDAKGNVCIGDKTLNANAANKNSGVGVEALTNNTTGSLNSGFGAYALTSNVSGTQNTALGSDAMFNNTTGSYNHASGSNALHANTTGSSNTASGAYALSNNTTGNFNSALGLNSLTSNTTGNYNTASGQGALDDNSTGSLNAAMGAQALLLNTAGAGNSALGYRAGGKFTGSNNTILGIEAGWRGASDDSIRITGNSNIAVGYQAGSRWNDGSNNIAIGAAGAAADANTIRIGTQGTQAATYVAGILGNSNPSGSTVVIDVNGRLGTGPAPGLPVIPGDGNTGIGTGALGKVPTEGGGFANTASGANALQQNTTGSANTASGAAALRSNTSGEKNTANGAAALQSNTSGKWNTATGVEALISNLTGNGNTASGFQALYYSNAGVNNTALGYRAGVNITTGSNNIAIGNPGAAADANTIRIGEQGIQKSVYVAGIFDATRKMKGTAVLVNNLGQLFIAKSSIRYKQDVRPMGDASNALMQLRPVTFRYRQADEDGTRPLQYGLIAEEVEKVMPDLVVTNGAGTPETVDYQALPSLLLNEVQKQSRELTATKAELAAAKGALSESKARLAAVEDELAALQLAVNRLASISPQGASRADLTGTVAVR